MAPNHPRFVSPAILARYPTGLSYSFNAAKHHALPVDIYLIEDGLACIAFNSSDCFSQLQSITQSMNSSLTSDWQRQNVS